MAVSERVLEDTVIDLNCVSININGIPNSVSNRRCENYPSVDGFVYTNSYKEENGEYKYQNALNKASGTYSDNIFGAAENSEIYTNMNVIRNNDANEGTINYVKAQGAIDGQFDGKPTKEFMYNEGNQPNKNREITVTNGKVDYGQGPGTTSNKDNDATTNNLTLSYNRYVQPSVLHIRNL